MAKNLVIPWIKCPCCDDYQCNVHSQAGEIAVHAHECECPPIEDWTGYGLWPYVACDLEKVEHMLDECSMEMEGEEELDFS